MKLPLVLPFALLLFVIVPRPSHGQIDTGIDRHAADFIVQPPELLLSRPAEEWESAISLCAEMGWCEREYALRKAWFESGRIRNLEEARAARKALAELAVRTGRDGEAARFLDMDASHDPEHLAARALARLRSGDVEKGVPLLRAAIDAGAPAQDLLLYRLAFALRSSEEGDHGIPILLDLAGRSNPYRTRSLHAAAALLFEQGREGEARKTLIRRYGASFSRLDDRELVSLLARQAAHEGRRDEAKKLWERVLDEWPSDHRALEAFRALRLLEEEEGGARDERLPLQGARAARLNGRTEEAMVLLRPYLDRPAEDPLHGEALLEMGRVSFGAERYESALEYFGKLTDTPGRLSQNALLYTARSYKKMGEWRKAIDAYDRYVKRFPGSSLSPEVQWEIAWRWKILGEYDKAAEAFRRLESTFPSSGYGRRAPLQEGLVLDLAGEPEKGLAALEKLLGRGDHPREEDAILFWSGDLCERTGRPERAAVHYTQLIEDYPESYYGLRAAGRMGVSIIGPPQDAGAADDGGDPLLAFVREWPAGTRRARVREWDMLQYFAFIGEWTEARREASNLIRDHRDDAESLVDLARLCRRLSLADYTIRCGRRLQELAERVGADPVHPCLLTLIYPAGYLDLVAAEARRYDDVDPFFVLGLMRQESWFRPDAHSRAGARGLLQIIPPTGRHIAREVGEGDAFDPDWLLEPERNIRYGIWYLRSLQRRYGGNLPIVASAYNAGETNADIWLSRSARFPEEEFVESINYSETRTYVKRTLSGYWIYRSLYRDLAARLLAG